MRAVPTPQKKADEALQTARRSSDVPEFGYERPIDLSIQFGTL